MAGGGSKPGERRGGRKRGTPNKLTAELKDIILQSLAEVGGVKYLITQAGAEPKSYMLLLGRVLPLQVKGDINGKLTIGWEE